MLRLFSCTVTTLFPILCTAAGFAQSAPTGNQASVAYVYVSSQPTNGKGQLYGFSTAANGQLTPIPATPLAADIGQLSLNGAWLFGITSQPSFGLYSAAIAGYSIAADGSLQLKSNFNLSSLPQGGYGASTFLDHTGATLYVGTDESEDTGYESFQIDQKTGQLAPLGYEGTGIIADSSLSFIGNNKYAYGAGGNLRAFGEVFGFGRRSNGALTSYISGGTPSAGPGRFYIPYLTAADPYNHVVVGEFPRDASTFVSDGPPQLAVYTSDNSGQLSTTSTYQNMPTTVTATPDDKGRFSFAMAMSPDGTHLAVSGDNGVQLFLMHGTNPPTAIPGAELLGVDIESLFWDNSGHLYVISNRAHALAVFNVTTTGGSLAPGSPYSIPEPVSLIVLPK